MATLSAQLLEPIQTLYVHPVYIHTFNDLGFERTYTPQIMGQGQNAHFTLRPTRRDI